MGFIKAFSGAVSGAFADQWKDFLMPKSGVAASAGLFKAVPNGTNNGRGENYKGNDNIITNGSKIVVPEGTALITVQDGKITGVVTEPGGFIFSSDDANSQSVFAGNIPFGSMWDKMTFGGQPGSQQLAFYVNLKEIPGLKIGTQSPVPYDDAFLETQVSVVARGSYSLKIVDPVSFVQNYVPVKYLQPESLDFDFADMDNEAGEQLFTEVVSCLGGAFTAYSNDAEHGGRLSGIMQHQDDFALTLSGEVENHYQWKSTRGLEIVRVAINVEYDEKTQALLDTVREDDVEIRRAKRMGAAYSNNMPGMMAAASGQAMQSAASNENGAMMGFMGMNMAQNQGSNMLNTVNQMNTQPASVQTTESNVNVASESTVASEDPMAKLANAKKMLDAGLITEEDYNSLKSQLLGL